VGGKISSYVDICYVYATAKIDLNNSTWEPIVKEEDLREATTAFGQKHLLVETQAYLPSNLPSHARSARVLN